MAEWSEKACFSPAVNVAAAHWAQALGREDVVVAPTPVLAAALDYPAGVLGGVAVEAPEDVPEIMLGKPENYAALCGVPAFPYVADVVSPRTRRFHLATQNCGVLKSPHRIRGLSLRVARR